MTLKALDCSSCWRGYGIAVAARFQRSKQVRGFRLRGSAARSIRRSRRNINTATTSTTHSDDVMSMDSSGGDTSPPVLLSTALKCIQQWITPCRVDFSLIENEKIRFIY
ncbi:unnamed protein product [Onchocerca flexuosa]|uniref:Uncharacterized protein n=1 Tax=Onchocerca flexuosa TaxID=387005 RepID=A0A183HUV7_9BILA|nr:unnamed protein product [Onchocerca flexuosa]